MKLCLFCGVENKDHVEKCTNCGHLLLNSRSDQKNKSSATEPTKSYNDLFKNIKQFNTDQSKAIKTDESEPTRTITVDRDYNSGITNPQNPIWINIYKNLVIITTILSFISSIVVAFQWNTITDPYNNTTSFNFVGFMGMLLLATLVLLIFYVFNMQIILYLYIRRKYLLIKLNLF